LSVAKAHRFCRCDRISTYDIIFVCSELFVGFFFVYEFAFDVFWIQMDLDMFLDNVSDDNKFIYESINSKSGS